MLTQDEKELGVALVDIGGGTADIAIFERGSLWHTGVVAVGGDHFTNDIAVGLRTPIPDAEKVKRKSGCALSSMVDEDETIEVASVGGRKPRLMARRILSEILQPRAEEIFHLVWDEIRRAGYEKALNSGIVLTGGGSILEGMPEIAEQIFDLPIRRGAPIGRRRAGRSRQQSGVCDAGRARALCAPQPRAGAGARRAPARSAGWPGGCAGCSRSFSEAGRGSDRWRTGMTEAANSRRARQELRLTLDRGGAPRRQDQGDRRRRRRQQRRQPHGGGRARAASSSSSPTPTCRRSTTTAPAIKMQIGRS